MRLVRARRARLSRRSRIGIASQPGRCPGGHGVVSSSRRGIRPRRAERRVGVRGVRGYPVGRESESRVNRGVAPEAMASFRLPDGITAPAALCGHPVGRALESRPDNCPRRAQRCVGVRGVRGYPLGRESGSRVNRGVVPEAMAPFRLPDGITAPAALCGHPVVSLPQWDIRPRRPTGTLIVWPGFGKSPSDSRCCWCFSGSMRSARPMAA